MNSLMVKPHIHGDIPDNFVCNVVKRHGGYSPQIDILKLLRQRDELKEEDDEEEDGYECRCLKCILIQNDEFRIGEPVQVHESFDVKLLKEFGYVGIYRDEDQ